MSYTEKYNKEWFKEYHKKHRIKHNKMRMVRYYEERATKPTRRMFDTAKTSAKRRGLEFSITINDIIIPKVCPILLTEFSYETGRSNAQTPSIDRVDNSKGYIPENIRVISWKANACKKDLTKDQIQRLYEYVSN